MFLALRRIVRAAVFMLLPVSLCFAEWVPYVVDHSPPRTISQTLDSVTIEFGPVRFTFPAEWRFSAGRMMSEAVGPRQGKAYVSVLRTTPEARAKGLVPFKETERASVRLANHVHNTCGGASLPEVLRLPSPLKREVVVAGCEVPAEHFFYVHYEIYTARTVVQVMVSGSGTVASAREAWDEIIQSQVWDEAI
jgi:hypothetical protein